MNATQNSQVKKQISRTFFQRYGIASLSLLFFGVYLLGTFFPDFWWTTHFLAFVSPGLKTLILVLAGGLVLYTWFRPQGFSFPKGIQEISNDHGKIIIPAITVLSGLLIYSFPIVQDHYGDAYKIIPYIDQKISTIPPRTSDALFSFELSPWAGFRTIMAVATYIAFYAGITYGDAFLWLDLTCGCLFVLAWLSFVRYYLNQAIWRLIMGLAGITAPFMLIYFGHIESYAPIFLFFLLWGMGAIIYLKTENQYLLWSLVPLLIFCVKLHPIALLFAPALGLLFLHHYRTRISWSDKFLTWKGISSWIIIPIFAAGAILYFFVFEDHRDPRALNNTAQAFDRLFLPLFSPEAPLDKYNLLSFNHIFDYFSEILLWSPIGLFVVGGIMIHQRAKINWQKLPLLITGLSLLLFSSLLFAINPLLSMQIDWDLMAIPAPIFLLFVVALVKEIEHLSFGKKIFPTSLALALLSLPIFIIHADVLSHSKRLESLGIRMYHTYYEWSGKVIQYSLDMPTYTTRQAFETRKNNVLDKLKPHAQKGIDFEYGRLLANEGKYHLRQVKDYPTALTYLKQSEFYFPKEKNTLLYLMEANFMQKEFQESFKYAMDLVAIQYPSERKSIAIAVHCALEAGEYNEAQILSNFYVEKWKDNPAIEKVKVRLESKTNVPTIKNLFTKP